MKIKHQVLMEMKLQFSLNRFIMAPNLSMSHNWSSLYRVLSIGKKKTLEKGTLNLKHADDNFVKLFAVVGKSREGIEHVVVFFFAWFQLA